MTESMATWGKGHNGGEWMSEWMNGWLYLYNQYLAAEDT